MSRVQLGQQLDDIPTSIVVTKDDLVLITGKTGPHGFVATFLHGQQIAPEYQVSYLPNTPTNPPISDYTPQQQAAAVIMLVIIIVLALCAVSLVCYKFVK